MVTVVPCSRMHASRLWSSAVSRPKSWSPKDVELWIPGGLRLQTEQVGHDVQVVLDPVVEFAEQHVALVQRGFELVFGLLVRRNPDLHGGLGLRQGCRPLLGPQLQAGILIASGHVCPVALPVEPGDQAGHGREGGQPDEVRLVLGGGGDGRRRK